MKPQVYFNRGWRGGIAPDLAALVRSTEGRGLTICPQRLAAVFGISQAALARLAGVHRNTLAASPGSERVQNTARALVRVLQAALALNPDHDAAIYWMRNAPIQALGCRTAFDLIKRGQDRAVTDYIASISGGTTG